MSRVYTDKCSKGDDYEGNRLTDVLEIHYLELKKLIYIKEPDEEKTLNDWMKFINCDSKKEMKALAEQNSDIEKAYDKLEEISKDEKARMIYEAREAYFRDEISQIKGARKKGRKERDLELITRLISLGKNDDEVCELLGIEKEDVIKVRDSH